MGLPRCKLLLISSIFFLFWFGKDVVDGNMLKSTRPTSKRPPTSKTKGKINRGLSQTCFGMLVYTPLDGNNACTTIARTTQANPNFRTMRDHECRRNLRIGFVSSYLLILKSLPFCSPPLVRLTPSCLVPPPPQWRRRLGGAAAAGWRAYMRRTLASCAARSGCGPCGGGRGRAGGRAPGRRPC